MPYTQTQIKAAPQQRASVQVRRARKAGTQGAAEPGSPRQGAPGTPAGLPQGTSVSPLRPAPRRTFAAGTGAPPGGRAPPATPTLAGLRSAAGARALERTDGIAAEPWAGLGVAPRASLAAPSGLRRQGCSWY